MLARRANKPNFCPTVTDIEYQHCHHQFELFSVFFFLQGFVVACSGNKNDMAMRLIKYFSNDQEDTWRKETELVKELSDGDGHANILKYCWHARSMEKYYVLHLFWMNVSYFGNSAIFRFSL